MAEKLTELFQCMWGKDVIPLEFKDASITQLYKRKGTPQVCDNNRVLDVHLDQAGFISESQLWFITDRGTIDMVFTARQLQEKCQKQNVDLYMTFVDLTKA